MSEKETIYQVKGADGLYHSVPESQMEAFHQRQEELRKAGKTGLPQRTAPSEEEMTDLRQKLSKLRQASRQKES